MEQLLDVAVTTTVDDWVLVRLSDEDLAGIKRRAETNYKAWDRVRHATQTQAAVLYRFNRLEKDAVRDMFYKLCGTTLELNFKDQLAITLVVQDKLPVSDFCHEFMFVLAANGIVLHKEGKRLIGELVDTRRM